MIVTRFAPSPTGRLHLGHAYSALQAHDLARDAGGRFLLRIEDIDGTRSRDPSMSTAILEDLRWLGLDWDGPVVLQSERLPLYAAALERLKRERPALSLLLHPRRDRGESPRRARRTAPDGAALSGHLPALDPRRVARRLARASRIAGGSTWRRRCRAQPGR